MNALEWADLEAIIQGKVDRLVEGGFSFDFIAGWVAQRRCWLGLDGRKVITS